MSPRSLKIALALSLALNLLVVGAIAGALISGGPPGRAAAPRAEIGALARGLDGPDRRALGRSLRNDAEIRQARAAMRAAGASIREALVADPFDPAALEAAMRSRQDAQAALGARGAAIFAATVATLSPEARDALARRMTRPNRPRD